MHVVIQGDVLVGDEAGFLGVVLGHPAQDHTQSGDDLFQGEGLGDVVVRADSQAVDTVLHAVLGGEEQGRGIVAGLAELVEQGEAVHAGHHDVQDEGVGAVGIRDLQRGLPVVSSLHVESLELQADLDQVGDVVLIVDDENLDGLRVWGSHGSIFTDLLPPRLGAC